MFFEPARGQHFAGEVCPCWDGKTKCGSMSNMFRHHLALPSGAVRFLLVVLRKGMCGCD